MKTVLVYFILIFPLTAFSRVELRDTTGGSTLDERLRRAESAELRRERPRREALRAWCWLPGEREARRAVADRSVFGGVEWLSLKANAASWAVAVMNVAVEARVSRRWTVELPVSWSPWHVGDRRSTRVLALQPEARFWLQTPGTGFFGGAHVHVAWFNVRWKRDRYQDSGRPLLGGGVSLGYALPLGGRWGAEFTAGAGYASIRYDTMYNLPRGARVSTRDRDYWGITRARIAVTWKINADAREAKGH